MTEQPSAANEPRCIHGYTVREDDPTVQECIDRHAQDAAITREEKEQRRDYNAATAETILARPDPDNDSVQAALAHATLAAYYQARIEWEHSVGF